MRAAEGNLLLHDGGSAGDTMAVQAGIDGVAGPLEEGSSNTLCTGCHRSCILTSQLLHQLSKLGPKMRTYAQAVCQIGTTCQPKEAIVCGGLPVIH